MVSNKFRVVYNQIIEIIESAVNITQLKHAWCRRLGHISSLDLHGLDNIHQMAFKKVSVAKVYLQIVFLVNHLELHTRT